jgi:hypothetical protein
MIYLPENKIIKPFSELLFPKPNFLMPQRVMMGAAGAGGGSPCVPSLIDSNTTYDAYEVQYVGANEDVGQAITLSANTEITSIELYLSKSGSPTGTSVVNLYASTGTIGSTAVPTGSSLANTNTLDVSTLTTDMQFIEFTFSPHYNASAGDICIVHTYTGGGPNDKVLLGFGYTSHAGNEFKRDTPSSAWDAIDGNDLDFKLYGCT